MVSEFTVGTHNTSDTHPADPARVYVWTTNIACPNDREVDRAGLPQRDSRSASENCFTVWSISWFVERG
jgi:hypothetical protein